MTMNKNRIYSMIPLLGFFILFFISPQVSAKTAIHELVPEPGQDLQCVKITRTLERYHYLDKHVDDEMSLKIFRRYIKRLDPGKRLFTLNDIKKFTPYRFRLDDGLKSGDLSIAFKIFNLYLKRSEQRLEYICSLIPSWKKEFDFTKNDSMILDNKLRRRKPTIKALHELWKKELKNHIIMLMLDKQEKKPIKDRLARIYSNRLKRLKQTNSNDIFQIFMNSVTSCFDPHTQYFPPRVSEDFDIHMSLSLEGIGAVLQTDDEYTKVVRLIPKGPADKSNLLMPGDKIIGVGQGETGEIRDTIGQRIDNVVKLIRGPKNTIVRLKIIPAKKSGSTMTIKIKRDKVKLEEQSAQKKLITIKHNHKILKIGVIEIPNFYIDFNAYHRGDKNYKSTTKDVRKLLKELKKENIDGLIIDLRDNGGGSLQEADQLTGLFLRSGPVVQIRTKYQTGRLYDDDPSIEYKGPLIVLINRMSASASEIFAGAIKDYHRGIIAGSRSFGKGTVQELIPLGRGRLKLTNAKFYRVSGESTQERGIVPDVKYPQIYRADKTGESSLDGALPWDTIAGTYYNAYPGLGKAKKQLNIMYEKRAVKDPGLIYLEKRVELISKINSRPSVSLNLALRKSRKKQYELAELDIENQYLKSMGKKPMKHFDQNNIKPETIKKILMHQTCLVMADFIDFAEHSRLSW